MAEEAGLHVDNGIVVNTDYQSSHPHIWAIGDVARAPDISSIRIESVHHAQYSAAVAAAAITGADRPAREAWWFWSDQYDVKFQMVGLLPSNTEQHRSVVRAGKRENSCSVWTWHKDKLVSIEAANDPQAYMIGKKCLEQDIHPKIIQIANRNFVLKTLLG